MSMLLLPPIISTTSLKGKEVNTKILTPNERMKPSSLKVSLGKDKSRNDSAIERQLDSDNWSNGNRTIFKMLNEFFL